MSLWASVGGTVIRLKWKPNRSVSANFKKLFLGDQQTVKEVMNEARDDIENYWKMNIYNYFDARRSAGLPNTGQLGRSLRIKIIGTRLEFYMVPMHNDRTKVFEFMRMPTMSGAFSFQPFSMPSVGIGIERDYDYGELLRNGFGPSPLGRYSYKYDCKVRPGSHPGYDANTRWVPWKTKFDAYSKQLLVDKMLDKMKQAGVSNVKPWKVDIHI